MAAFDLTLGPRQTGSEGWGRDRSKQMKMDKRMVNIVGGYSHGIKHGYKIFKENLSLAFTEQIFCLIGERFCLPTPSPLPKCP